MNIKILAPEDLPIDEKAIQTAFEKDLSKLEEGLDFVGSEVVIGTGRIDTLAFDTINNRPVFIEYKRRGAFDKDALLQLMDYLSWFTRDENRMAILEKLVRQRKPEITDFEQSIGVICVASDITDRIRNAIYAVANDVKVFSYVLARDTANNFVLVPKLEVDNSEVELRIPQPASEDALLEKHAHLRDFFQRLRPILQADGATAYTTAKSFRFKKSRVFAKVRFRKKFIQIELRPGKGAIDDPDFKFWRQGASSWGYVNLYPVAEIPEKVVNWINIARNFVGQPHEDEDDDGPEAQ